MYFFYKNILKIEKIVIQITVICLLPVHRLVFGVQTPYSIGVCLPTVHHKTHQNPGTQDRPAKAEHGHYWNVDNM